jgi:hypothetical protein
MAKGRLDALAPVLAVSSITFILWRVALSVEHPLTFVNGTKDPNDSLHGPTDTSFVPFTIAECAAICRGRNAKFTPPTMTTATRQTIR